MNSNQMIILMMLAFVIKHYLCDFPLQTPYMLKKGAGGYDWVLPLLAHSWVHAIFSAVILVGFGQTQWIWVAGMEFIAHFIIDRIKATYKLPQGKWEGAQKYENLSKYYRAFGIDQLAHYITYILMLMIIFQ